MKTSHIFAIMATVYIAQVTLVPYFWALAITLVALYAMYCESKEEKKDKPADFLVYYSFDVRTKADSPTILNGNGQYNFTDTRGICDKSSLRWVRKQIVSGIQDQTSRAKKKRVTVLIHNVMKLPIK